MFGFGFVAGFNWGFPSCLRGPLGLSPTQCDSTNAISIAKNLVLHSKTKHMEVRYYFLRDKDNVEKGKIFLIHVPTHHLLADIFTKPLDQATFTHLRGGLVFV
jgi:hypothetical protein